MKKIALIIISAFMLIVLTACGAGGFVEPVFPAAPWGDADTIREVKTYRVEIFRPQATLADTRYLLAEGTLVHTLEGTGYNRDNRLVASSDFNITWSDYEGFRDFSGQNHGVTDRIVTGSTFMPAGLVPVTSYRNAILANRYDAYGNFDFNNSHEISTRFREGARDSQIRIGKNQAGQFLNEANNIAVPADPVFCNEQLFYVMRGLSNIRPGGSVSLPVNNVLDNHIRGTASAMPIQIGSPPELRRTPIHHVITDPDSPIYGETTFDFRFLNPLLRYEYTAPTYLLTMELTAGLGVAPAGPAHRFFVTYNDVGFYSGNLRAHRLILSFDYAVFDIYGRAVFHIVHTLIGYSIS